VPKGTPAEIVERLNREVNAALADRTVKARMVGPNSFRVRRVYRRMIKWIAHIGLWGRRSLRRSYTRR